MRKIAILFGEKKKKKCRIWRFEDVLGLNNLQNNYSENVSNRILFLNKMKNFCREVTKFAV